MEMHFDWNGIRRKTLLVLGFTVFFILCFSVGFVRWCLSAQYEQCAPYNVTLQSESSYAPGNAIVARKILISKYGGYTRPNYISSPGAYYPIYSFHIYCVSICGDTPVYKGVGETYFENDFQWSFDTLPDVWGINESGNANNIGNCDYSCPEKDAFLSSCPLGQGTFDCNTMVGECSTDDNCENIIALGLTGVCGEYPAYCITDQYGYSLEDGCCSNSTCEGDPQTPQDDCNQLEQNCRDACGSAGAQSFNCRTVDGVTTVSSPCSCYDSSNSTIQNGYESDRYYEPQSSDITTPNSSTSDPNARITATNTETMTQILGSELPEINSRLGSIQTAIESQNPVVDNSSFTGSLGTLGSYSGDPGSFSGFSARIDSFKSSIESSDLYGLPGQVLGNIPSSTDHIVSIDFGSHGVMNLDLESYASVYSVLRTIFLICASIVAVRIVLLKG